MEHNPVGNSWKSFSLDFKTNFEINGFSLKVIFQLGENLSKTKYSLFFFFLIFISYITDFFFTRKYCHNGYIGKFSGDKFIVKSLLKKDSDCK